MLRLRCQARMMEEEANAGRWPKELNVKASPARRRSPARHNGRARQKAERLPEGRPVVSGKISSIPRSLSLALSLGRKTGVVINLQMVSTRVSIRAIYRGTAHVIPQFAALPSALPANWQSVRTSEPRSLSLPLQFTRNRYTPPLTKGTNLYVLSTTKSAAVIKKLDASFSPFRVLGTQAQSKFQSSSCAKHIRAKKTRSHARRCCSACLIMQRSPWCRQLARSAPCDTYLIFSPGPASPHRFCVHRVNI